MSQVDWDTFRYVVAIADAGSASAAAERLGVDASTVQRKIARFEQDNGVTLFERKRSGYRPSVEGAAIIELARSMEEGVSAIRRTVLGQDLRLEGRVSVTTTDSLAHSVLTPHLVSFRECHSRIMVDLTVTNRRLSLTRLDADIAVRPSLDPPPNLIAKRVATLAIAAYGAPVLGTNQRGVNALVDGDLPWIGLGEGLDGSPAHRFVSRHVSTERMGMTADTFPAIGLLARQGAGIALLPCSLGDAMEGLVRLSDPIDDCATGLWVLTHPDTRQSARIGALSAHLVERLTAEAPRLEGRPV